MNSVGSDENFQLKSGVSLIDIECLECLLSTIIALSRANTIVCRNKLDSRVRINLC